MSELISVFGIDISPSVSYFIVSGLHLGISFQDFGFGLEHCKVFILVPPYRLVIIMLLGGRRARCVCICPCVCVCYISCLMLTIMWTNTKSTTYSTPRGTCFLCRHCYVDPPVTSILISNIRSTKMLRWHQQQTPRQKMSLQWRGFTTWPAMLVSLFHPVIITWML